jgi:hypothetical protein
MSWPSLCIRECIDAQLDAVLDALDNVASSGYPTMRNCERVYGRMATAAVEFDGLDATLRVFPLVGGTQEPVTELLLSVGASDGDQATSARRFLVELVRLVETELHASPASPIVAGAPA